MYVKIQMNEKRKKKKRNYNTTKLDVLHFSFFIFNWNIVWFTNLWTEIIIYLCLNCVCAFYDNQSLFLVFVRYIFFHIFWTIHFKPFEKFILHFISSMEKKNYYKMLQKLPIVEWVFLGVLLRPEIQVKHILDQVWETKKGMNNCCPDAENGELPTTCTATHLFFTHSNLTISSSALNKENSNKFRNAVRFTEKTNGYNSNAPFPCDDFVLFIQDLKMYAITNEFSLVGDTIYVIQRSDAE